MSRTCPPGRRARRRVLVLSTLATLAACTASAPAAQAADLLVLDGDQVTLQGGVDYGIVYIDGELRLSGDTLINAASVYIGPNASLRTCWVPSGTSGSDSCTNGRSLEIRSRSTLTVEPSIDLTGRTGTVRPGGSLTLSGTDVAIGGQITTAGTGAASGSVAITAGGLASTGPITAYGAPVTIAAARDVSVNGDIHTEGATQIPAPPGRQQGAAPVDIRSSGGDVAVRGAISAFGRDAAATQGGGGVGADVTLGGSDVRVGAIDATGGTSADLDGGPSGRIHLTARGALQALGRLDAGASGSTGGTAGGAGEILAAAGGPALLAGGAGIAGANAPGGGSSGGHLDVQGASVTIGNVTAGGGSASSAAAPNGGGMGGIVTVRSAATASLGTITAGGGAATGGAQGGAGGAVAVVAASTISTGSITTTGGSTPAGPGADGGQVTLDADGGLALGGPLSTSGGDGGANVTGTAPGGAAGHVLLRAAGGTLDLGGPVRSTGGRGSASALAGVGGGPGGAGGSIDLVAHILGTVVSITSAGGDGGENGDSQGPGGVGGAIHAFTDGPLFDDLKVVAADGGDGRPTGPAGARTLESSPTGAAVSPTGVLGFTSRSPGADRYRVMSSLDGAPATALGETAAKSLPVTAPVCHTVTLTVVALQNALRWTSEPSAPVTWRPQPSATQTCAQVAGIRSAEKQVRRKLATVRRAHWKLGVTVVSTGMGHVRATLQQGKRKIVRLGTVEADVSSGRKTLRITLPKAHRRAANLTLVLVTASPDGSHKTTTRVPIALLRDARTTPTKKGAVR